MEEEIGRSDNEENEAEESVVADKDYEVTVINSDEEETIQEIPVNNACILPDQYMPTLKEIMEESKKIMDEARTKMRGLFDFYTQQYQSEEIKEKCYLI